MAGQSLIIEPLGKHHDRSSFSCGVVELDRYFKEQANQDLKRRVSTVIVAAQSTRVIGFYTLSATSISRDSLPVEVMKKLPRYPIPAVLLGRLATDKSCHGMGFGKTLLINAMKRALSGSTVIGMYALIVDAKDEGAKAFYKHFGFIEFIDQPMRLFLSLDTIDVLVNGDR